MDIAASGLATQILTQITAVAVDFEGRVLFWNEGAERMYGHSTEEMLGKSVSDAYRCEFMSGQNEQQVLMVARKTGKWSGVCIHILRDSRKILVESEIPCCAARGMKKLASA